MFPVVVKSCVYTRCLETRQRKLPLPLTLASCVRRHDVTRMTDARPVMMTLLRMCRFISKTVSCYFTCAINWVWNASTVDLTADFRKQNALSIGTSHSVHLIETLDISDRFQCISMGMKSFTGMSNALGLWMWSVRAVVMSGVCVSGGHVLWRAAVCRLWGVWEGAGGVLSEIHPGNHLKSWRGGASCHVVSVSKHQAWMHR